MTAWAVGVQACGPNDLNARCSCGWEGPPREYHTEAMQDALNHATDATHGGNVHRHVGQWQ